jgi:uncharacterized membrane protein
MTVVLLVFGAVLGALATEVHLFGAALGALAGWLLSSQRRLQAELDELRRLPRLATPTPHEAQHEAAAPPAPTAGAPTPANAIAERETAPSPGYTSRADRPDSVAAARSMDAVAVAAATAVPTAAAPPTARPAPEPQRWTPPPPTPPPAWQLALERTLRRWFTEGNVPVKLGMLVLFFGVGALLKYAADQGLFALPIELRLAGVAIAGVAALAFGWRQRLARPAFALALQGGAIGILLLTVFGAYRIWHLLPPGLAFGLMLVLVVGSALLALLQNAIALAVLGSVGGFLAPVLVSTGSGDHVALFGYYALLNAAIFAIAWWRPWRVLNLVGFVFTFAIGTLWGYRYYTPEHFASTEPFLILFFLFYVAIAVLYALRQPQARRGLVDGSLLFGTPLLAFPLQVALLDGEPMGLAYSALAVALLYGGLATALIRRPGLRTLALSFAALALGFATLAVPLALDAGWTACTWALEGAALVWLGLRQQQRWPVYAGVALQALAGVAFLITLAGPLPAQLPILNGALLAGLLLAGAALFSAYRLEQDGGWPRFAWIGLGVGIAWWAVAGMREVERFADFDAALVGWQALGLALAALARWRLPWPRLAWPLLIGFGFGLLLAAGMSISGGLPLSAAQAGAWLLWLAAGGFALRVLREPEAQGLALAHLAWLLVLATLGGFELQARIALQFGSGSAWATVALMLPLATLLWAAWRHPRRLAFPLADQFEAYRAQWFALGSMLLALWWAASLGHDGDAAPLPWLPLLNPLDLAQVGLLLMLFGLWREQADASARPLLAGVGAAVGFVTVSVATLRAVHHLAGLAWDSRLWSTMLAQTSLTVVWSLLGVAAWIYGSKRGSRPVWLAGAVLMGVVLAKLILIDRGHMGDVPGIVSFVAVGLLLTVVGYFAPSPPRTLAPEAQP